MINAVFRPLEQWPNKPTPPHQRKNGNSFRATQSRRLDLLERELNHLGARDIVVQAYFDREDIRNDGWPRSSARTRAPSVIVSFSNKAKESFSYPCDTYQRWEDNLYAIALSLEALRAVDRYGVTKGGQQYQGFKRLEAPSVIDARVLAESFICTHAGVSLVDLRADLGGAYKAAAVKLHPDKVGHDELFKQLQEHLRVLRAAHA